MRPKRPGFERANLPGRSWYLATSSIIMKERTKLRRRNLGHLALLFALSLALTAGCARRPESGTGPTTKPVTQAEKASLMVFSGAANTPPLTELAKDFEGKANCRVDVTFAGSGTLLNQIDLEKVGDVYVPGSDDFMEKAKQKGAVDPGTEKLVAWLVPTINVAKGNPKGVKELKDLAKPGVRVCIADAKAVCLGGVAEEILKKAGLQESVKKNVATYALSCEEVENLVETGEVDAAIGWDVFDQWAPEKIENVPIPKELAQRRYIPAAVVTYSKQKELAQQFVDFVSSEEGNSVYSKHGYTIPQAGETPPTTLGH